MSEALPVDEPINYENTSFSKQYVRPDVMEALEHLYITRKYKELELCINCKNNGKICIKHLQNVGASKNKVLFEKNLENTSLSSNNSCSNSSSKESSKWNCSNSLRQENVDRLILKNLMLNNNEERPYKICSEQIKKISQNCNVKKTEILSYSNKEEKKNYNMHILNKKTKKPNDFKKNLRRNYNLKKKSYMKPYDKKLDKSVTIEESKGKLNCKEKSQEMDNNDQSDSMMKKKENQIENSEFSINKNKVEKIDEINYSVKEEAVEKSCVIPPQVEEIYVIDTIAENSKGIILLTPGRNRIRFGSIIPDDDAETKFCLEKINSNSSDVLSIEANEGDFVLVSYNEKNNQRGKVLCKLGSIYYILLIDFGIIMSTDKVYSFPTSMNLFKGLGIVITMQEIFSEELVREIDECFYSVIEKKDKGKWKCRLTSIDKQDPIANVIIEKPIKKGSTRTLKSGCLVEISSPGLGNTFYVREIDETSGWKLNELNKKINAFCKKAPCLRFVPKLGYLCSARFKDDQNFYRGLVKSVNNDQIEILFVDFGNTQFIDISSNSSSDINIEDLKLLPPRVEAIPFFAIKVSLADVLNKPYSLKVKTYLQKLIMESTELVLTYTNFKQGVYLKEKLTGNSVNDFLNDNLSEIPETCGAPKKVKFFGDRMKYTIFTVGTKCEMAFLYVNDKEFADSYTFWCSDASSKNFKYVNLELSSKISAYCKSCTEPYRPSKRELCLAQFEGMWYRALAVDVNDDDDDNFIVFFPDFGNMCELTSKYIRQTKEEFIECSALAVNCTIIDPERLKGKPELCKKVFELLNKWMNEANTSQVEICNYKDETFFLRIPEIEAIFSDQ